MNAFSRKTLKVCFALALVLTFFGCSGGDKEDNPQPQPYETYSSSDADTGDSSSSDYIDEGSSSSWDYNAGGGSSSSWNDTGNGGYSSSSEGNNGKSSSSWDDTGNGGYSSSSGDNNPKEVVSVRTYTITIYNTSTGEVSGISEGREEYEYYSDGSLKQIIVYNNGIKSTLHEYNSNGDTQRMGLYDTDGNITYEYRYQTTTAIINSIKRTTQEIVKYYTSGELYSYTQRDIDWNSDASFCNITVTSYNAAGEQTSSSTSEARYTYVTIGSKTLEASIVYGNDVSKYEYEYNDKGDMTMSILYSRQTDTGILVKSNESTFTYTYITL